MLLTLLAAGLVARASDHAEAPGAQADPAADLNDIYAWHTSDGSIVAVVTVAPFLNPGTGAVYDADVLYTVNIDTNADQEADIEIHVRFGQDPDTGEWGVQVENLPGASGTISGAVETVLTDGDVKVYAGLRDDPFFFDVVGFTDTLSTATVSFTAADGFAGYNTTAIVLEFDTAATTGSAHSIQLWATSGRK